MFQNGNRAVWELENESVQLAIVRKLRYTQNVEFWYINDLQLENGDECWLWIRQIMLVKLLGQVCVPEARC